MSTSGTGIASQVLFVALLIAVVRGGGLLPARPGRPLATIGLTVVIGSASVLGLLVPAVYAALYRDPALVVAQHQWWRVVTSLTVQDGGLLGTAFNLVSLVAIGATAERYWGSARTVAIFLGCGLPLNVLAVAFGAAGAGNSGATFALGASITAALVLHGGPARLAGLVVVAAGVALVATGDAHGIAVLLGAVVGAGVALIKGRRSSDTSDERPFALDQRSATS